MKILATSLLLGGLLTSAAGAQEDIDWILVWTIYADEAAGARLFVIPDGQGAPFTEAYAEFGSTVDATVQITMTDYSYQPIVGFPAEDLWLAATAGNLVACTGGIRADGPTNEDGAAFWTLPPRAGGSSIGGSLHGVVSGYDLATVIPLAIVSADLSGDLTVNLVDIVLFTEALGGGPDWDHADFSNDGQVNLTDIVLFTGGLGAICP